jgi:hypothetical protein
MSSAISTTRDACLFGGNQTRLWNRLVANINDGMPMSLATFGGSGLFGSHYTNLFGYEEWTGVNASTGEFLTRRYIKGFVNYASVSTPMYCDARVLDEPMITLFAYHFVPTSFYDCGSSDFYSSFSNPVYSSSTLSGLAQIPGGHLLNYQRLRCGNPAQTKLTLSANKIGTGNAFLQLSAFHTFNSVTIDFSSWSANELYADSIIQIQFYMQGMLYDHVSFSPSLLPTYESGYASKRFLFPCTATGIRISLTCPNPNSLIDNGRVIIRKISIGFNGFEYPPFDFGEEEMA